MLPKFVYESLPYVNLAIGAVVICRYQGLLMAFSGILFFIVGSLMWTMRSDNRRKDQNVRLRDYGHINRKWYELKPFFYMLFGMLSVTRLEWAIIQMTGLSVALFGLYLLVKRSLHRHLARPGKTCAPR